MEHIRIAGSARDTPAALRLIGTRSLVGGLTSIGFLEFPDRSPDRLRQPIRDRAADCDKHDPAESSDRHADSQAVTDQQEADEAPVKGEDRHTGQEGEQSEKKEI